MILLAYRHGLRASEVTGLRMSDLDLGTGTIYCRRAKGSRSSLHPMKPDEVAALQKVLPQSRAARERLRLPIRACRKDEPQRLLANRIAGR